MYVIDVVPFVRGAPSDTLSYRSKTLIQSGTIVSVPFRNREVMAVVTACIPVRDAKSFLKKASFIPRNVKEQTLSSLPKTYYTAALATANIQSTSFGEILRQLFTNDSLSVGFQDNLLFGNKFIQKQCEAPYEDRLQTYRALCDNTSGKGTILFVVPSVIEAKRLATHLVDNSVLIHGKQKVSKRKEMINKSFDSPIVIVTPAYAFIPIKCISIIVIERESAQAFVNIQYPYTNMRIALNELARSRHITLLVGDYPIRLETRIPHNKILQNKYVKKIQILSTRPNDMRIPEQRYTTIPFPLRKIIQHTLDKDGRVLLMAVRRGYASTAVCKDCGESVRDVHGRSLSLATQNGKRVFRSSDGTIIKNADIHCANCDSWNLVPLGAGIERVEEDVNKYFPNSTIIRFDSDTVKNVTMATQSLQKARAPKTILMGTEKLIPWLEPKDLFSTVIIVSADSLLAIPFWRAHERFMRIALSLAQHTQQLTIATRHPKDTVCQALTQSSLSPFFMEELQLRKMLHYPPYGNLLIFRITGNETYIARGESLLQDIFTTNQPNRLPDHIITKDKRVRILIYKQKTLPGENASRDIARLPRYITYSINGESFW